jgi:integrase
MGIDEVRLKLYRGTWCAVWREHGKTRRASLRTTDTAEAKRRLIDWTEAGKRKSGGTVAEIVDLYIKDRKDKASAGTMKVSWKALASTFGHLLPDHVDVPITRAYAQKRRRAKISDSTIVRELGVLRSALRWHDRNTPAVVEVPASPPPRTYHLSVQEWRSFREATKVHPHLHVFAVLAYSTAGRASAVLQLTWDRVDFARGLVDLGRGDSRLKGRAVVPMNDSLRAVLEEARKAALSEYVVEWAGRPVASVKKAFGNAAAVAGLPRLTPHVLRHTAAVRLAEAGCRMEEIAQYLGHTNTRVTYRVYARYSPDYLRHAASALD